MLPEEGGSSFEPPIEYPNEVVPASRDTASEDDAKAQWNRRTFFKAAALGTAAAAMYEGGRAVFTPVVAFADNLSSLNCTANDVRIVGPGQIINEPCTCTGTFNAQVRFRVVNNTGTTRYCVTAHFCPGALPGGGNFDPGDILIGDIPPKSDAFYTVNIPNYPCGAGLVCFGACGTGTDPDTGQPDCSFAKGEACPAGQCCSTVSWDVNPGCPTRVISSKCRHQQICIQGRGQATLDCNTTTIGVQTNCPVACGATTTLRLCTTEAASFGPFVFTLTGGGTTQTVTSAGPCADFTVGPITDTTLFTGTVRSNDGCVKSATATVTTTPITVTLNVAGEEACNSGNLTFTASTGRTGCTYEWRVDGTVVSGVTGATFNYPADPDSTCHRVSVKATCGGCESNTASITVQQCVTTTTGCTP